MLTGGWLGIICLSFSGACVSADDTKQSVNSFMAAFGSFTDIHEFIPLNLMSSKKKIFVIFSYDRQRNIFFV